MSIAGNVTPPVEAFRFEHHESDHKQVKRVIGGGLHPNQTNGFDEITSRLVQCLSHIIRTFDCRESPSYLLQARSLLDSLPLATPEYDLAQHQLENAQRYADSDEAGAAIYELRILLAKFRSTT